MVKVRELLFKVFPKFNNSTFEVLKDRFKALGFTDERALDSVNNVIDTYEGWDKLPNIANFIQFDKKVRLYEYDELLKETNDFSAEAREKHFDKFVFVKSLKKFVKKDYEKYFRSE